MIRWLQRLWWQRQRSIDLAILWPVIKKEAADLDHARQIFMMHALNDACWVREYEGRLWEVVKALK